MRFAIVDTSAGKVINVVIYDATPPNPPPGFGPAIIAVQSDRAGMDWTWNGAALVAPPAPAPPPQTVFSQDLVAQFSATDVAAIQSAISSNPSFLLLWYSLLAQKDPMTVSNQRFQTGWSALVQVLGQPRMSAIASALGLTL
jgi:hypothetical protein